MSIDVKEAFKNVFKGEDWKTKFGVLVVLYLISNLTGFMPKPQPNQFDTAYGVYLIFALIGIVVGLIITGYAYQYLHNLIKDAASDLPDWEDLGTMLVNAVKLSFGFFVIGLCIFLPVMIIGIPALIFNNSLAVAIFGLTAIIATVFGIAIWIMSCAITLCFVEEFKFAEIFNFKKAKKYLCSDYFMAIVWSVLLGFGAIIIMIIPSMINQYLGGITICIAAPILMLVCNNLYAQVYQNRKEVIN